LEAVLRNSSSASWSFCCYSSLYIWIWN